MYTQCNHVINFIESGKVDMRCNSVPNWFIEVCVYCNGSVPLYP